MQNEILADPVESEQAQRDVRGLKNEEERLKLVDRGHTKILFRKLRKLDNRLRDVVQMRAAENREALAGVEDKTMTKAKQEIQSAQDLLAATHMTKLYKYEPRHRNRELPSQRAMAAADRARARLHAKWLQSHPWAANAHFKEVRSQTLVARARKGGQGVSLQLHSLAALGRSLLRPDVHGAQEMVPQQGIGAQYGAQQVASYQALPHQVNLEPRPLQQTEHPIVDGALPLSQVAGVSYVSSVSPLQVAATGGDGAGQTVPVKTGDIPEGASVGEAYEWAEEKADAAVAAAEGGLAPAPTPKPFHPCTNGGCRMEKMLGMPPLVDEFNRTWVGDDTNRTWLDAMTGSKPVGSSMKVSGPFEEKGGGPGGWYVRRYDKETVPGWWETEPGPGDAQGGLIPGPHDRVYHALEHNTKGEWKKEGDGNGSFLWVFYAPWKKPKPPASESNMHGAWATEQKADGSVRWVWCGPHGLAGAEGDKSVDEYGQSRMAEGACHGVDLERQRLAQEAEEKKNTEQQAKTNEKKRDKIEEEEKEVEAKEEEIAEDKAAQAAQVQEEIKEEQDQYDQEREQGHVSGHAPWLHREAADIERQNQQKHPTVAPWLHPVKEEAVTRPKGTDFWQRDADVFAGAGGEAEGAVVVDGRGGEGEGDGVASPEENGKAMEEGVSEAEERETEAKAGSEAALKEQAEEKERGEEDGYRDISKETYEALQYPRESPQQVELEREERERRKQKEGEEYEKEEGYPKYIVNPTSVPEAYDFDGVLMKKEDKVAGETEGSEKKEAELETEQKTIDAEKKEIEEEGHFRHTMGGRIAENEKRLWEQGGWGGAENKKTQEGRQEKGVAVEDGAAPKEEGGGGGQEEEESEEEAVKDPSNLYAAPPVCLSLSLCMSLECTCGAPLCVFFVGLSVRCIFHPPPPLFFCSKAARQAAENGNDAVSASQRACMSRRRRMPCR